MSRQTSLMAAAVHAVVFVLVSSAVMKYFYSTEGFAKADGESCSKSSECASTVCNLKLRKCVPQTAGVPTTRGGSVTSCKEFKRVCTAYRTECVK
jgi:hypothetical protein